MSNQIPSDDRIIKACMALLASYDYSEDPSWTLDVSLPGTLVKVITSWGLGLEKEEKHVAITRFSAAVPDLMFKSHPFEVKVLIGTWIWLSYCIEHDTAGMGEPAISQFQRLMVTQKPQQHPILDQYAAVLGRMYDFKWDQMAIDCIVTSSLHLIWSFVLERKAIYRSMSPLPGGHLWPAAIRFRNGLGEALTYLTFLPPKGHEGNEMDYIRYVQAIPQIQIFLNFTNDILRFNWEETEEVHDNYIRERTAHQPGKEMADTLDEMVVEAGAAIRAVDMLMKGTGWMDDRWKVLRHGFIAMHRWDKAPYQLAELGLAEDIQYSNSRSSL